MYISVRLLDLQCAVVDRSGAIAVSVLQECPLVSAVGEGEGGREREMVGGKERGREGEGEGGRGGREGGRERGRSGVGRIPSSSIYLAVVQ
jgi:hypothetical protein